MLNYQTKGMLLMCIITVLVTFWNPKVFDHEID